MKSRIKEIISSHVALISITLFIAFQIMGLIVSPQKWYIFIFSISIFLLGCYLLRRSFYKPKDIICLKMLIDHEIKKKGKNCNLNHIDVSRMKNMELLFYESEFNGDISKWDVSNIENMDHMFEKSQFNGDISKWNVSKVKSMNNIFWNSVFNGNITKWDVRNVETIKSSYFMSKPIKENNGEVVFPPYWAEIDEKLMRDSAIENHLLYKDLKTNLNNDRKKEKKLKL